MTIKVKHRFKVGDTVYFIDNNRILEGKVFQVRIFISCNKGNNFIKIVYNLEGSGINLHFDHDEANLFKTRKELLHFLDNAFLETKR